MSARKSSHGTIFLIVSSGSPLAVIASSLRSTSKKPFCPMTRSLHRPYPRAVTESDSRARGERNFSRRPLGSTTFRAPNGAIRQDLVAAIGTWLSAQFSLPTIEQQPIIKLVPPEEIVALRYNLPPGASAEDHNDTVAIYHDATQTIYLPQDWNGNTPAEQS